MNQSDAVVSSLTKTSSAEKKTISNNCSLPIDDLIRTSFTSNHAWGIDISISHNKDCPT